MQSLFLLLALSTLSACTRETAVDEPARGQAHEEEHYREWSSGSGWIPDYHDK